MHTCCENSFLDKIYELYNCKWKKVKFLCSVKDCYDTREWYQYFFININDSENIPKIIKYFNDTKFSDSYNYSLVDVCDKIYSTNEIESMLWKYDNYNAKYESYDNKSGVKIIKI